MSTEPLVTIMDLTDEHERALQVLAHGRSNTHHVCQQADLDERSVKAVLADLCGAHLVVEVDRDLYQITRSGREALEGDYPVEVGFLQASDVIHDAPNIKTVRLRGDRGFAEVQVDATSVHALADALAEVLAETHGETDLSAVTGSGSDDEQSDRR
ncbi:hypothetical protein [Halorientalis pallida]|uniref:Uncharacterized protein n=1 Tax=Halorientalis pallida TaxID=2479928 RepID=A0A498L2E2_9EURY|nr:hypothetical protein [Halorientalis pallida]RXK47941.1 hypothetical protein EAF64_15010 [Halorientalis pallida]